MLSAAKGLNSNEFPNKNHLNRILGLKITRIEKVRIIFGCCRNWHGLRDVLRRPIASQAQDGRIGVGSNLSEIYPTHSRHKLERNEKRREKEIH